jgi:hypothetical protein
MSAFRAERNDWLVVLLVLLRCLTDAFYNLLHLHLFPLGCSNILVETSLTINQLVQARVGIAASPLSSYAC